MQHRPEIDGLRAVAVLPVILFHAGFETFSGGFVGVDVFFVISGFLITTILIGDLESGLFSVRGFYERRVRRILPALFFVIACCIPVAAALMIPMQLAQFAESVLAVVFFVSNFFFWSQTDYFGPAAEEQPLLHTWSLSVEEQYYLLFPLALAGLWRLGRTRVAVALGTVAFFSLLASVVASRFWPAGNFYLLPTRAWELLAGSLCAFYLKNGAAIDRNATSDAAALTGIALIGGSIFLFHAETPTPSLFALMPVAGACLVLLFASPSSFAARILCLKPLVGVGLVSYSAYLWHQPLLAFVRIGSKEPAGQNVMFGVVITTLALATLTWRYVEVPFRRKLQPSAVLRSTASAAMTLIVASLAVISTRGLHDFYVSHRLDPKQAAMFELVQKQMDIAMDRTLFDDGGCRFIAREVTEDFARRFAACAKQYGPGLVVVGDSHAMNLYNILAKANLSPFIAAVARGGCRPHTPKPHCHYDGLDAWAKVARSQIRQVIYHQSGSYFLRDENGKVDSDKAFDRDSKFSLADDHVEGTARYLAKLSEVVPVIWFGPFVEARVRFENLDYLSTGLRMNETSAAHFRQLDNLLKSYDGAKKSYHYVSLVDFLALDPDFLLTGECVTYRDVDHFSACGEDILARRNWHALFNHAQTSER